jgi:hypothetical protein
LNFIASSRCTSFVVRFLQINDLRKHLRSANDEPRTTLIFWPLFVPDQPFLALT